MPRNRLDWCRFSALFFLLPILSTSAGPRQALGREEEIADQDALSCSLGTGAWEPQKADFGWRCELRLGEILDEIACHAERHADWLEISAE